MTVVFEKNKDLSTLTTFHTLARAEFFYEAKSLFELKAALEKAKLESLTIHLLGGGANTIAMPFVKGLVLKIGIERFSLLSSLSGDTLIEVGAGNVLDATIGQMLNMGWAGLEGLTAVPGSVGGAVVQNAGAYGSEISEFIQSVEVLDQETLTITQLDREACQFLYRDSIFKSEAGKKWIILGVTLRLARQWKPRLSYKELSRTLRDDQTYSAQEISAHIRALRAKKLPNPDEWGNSGSFFKNPIVSKVFWKQLVAQFPSMVSYPMGGNRMKLGAGWLIQEAGFKGFAGTHVAVYDKHALVLINRDGATGEDVLAFAEQIQKGVYDKFGVELEKEPVWMS